MDPDTSAKIVGNPEFVAAGYDAQVKSTTLFKNKNDVLPLSKRSRVYIPKLHIPGYTDWMGKTYEERWQYPVNIELVKQYFDIVETPDELIKIVLKIK